MTNSPNAIFPSALLKLRRIESPSILQLREILTALLAVDFLENIITEDDWMKIGLRIMTLSGTQAGEFAAKVALGQESPDPNLLELSEERSRRIKEFAIGLDEGEDVKVNLQRGLDLLNMIELCGNATSV